MMLLMRVNKIKSPSLAEFATFAALRIANFFDAEPYLSKDPIVFENSKTKSVLPGNFSWNSWST